MYWCFWLIYMRRDCFNEWKTEKRHECTNMGKLKRLELWWQLYVTSQPERDVRNIRPLDFCWTECTWRLTATYIWYKPIVTITISVQLIVTCSSATTTTTTHTQKTLLRSHANAPQCYVTRTLPKLLSLWTVSPTRLRTKTNTATFVHLQ
jgi:hypothetical protein